MRTGGVKMSPWESEDVRRRRRGHMQPREGCAAPGREDSNSCKKHLLEAVLSSQMRIFYRQFYRARLTASGTSDTASMSPQTNAKIPEYTKCCIIFSLQSKIK